MKKTETQEKNERKALFTSRLLFISVLDKIYLIILLLMFLSLTAYNFSGDIASISYGFWARIGREILIILGLALYYLLLNWFYKCAAKTMLCITENEVYKEHYVPFKRTETSIPLSKITGATTIKVFWIFRAVIIHQYNKLPMIFLTWTNQEFKDKLNELVNKEDKKIENEYSTRNIITKDNAKFLKYLGLVLGFIIEIIAVVKFFSFVFSTERALVGTYVYQNNAIVLNSNGSCNIDDIKDDVTECTWSYDKDEKEVNIDYEYEYYYSYYYGSSTSYDSIYLDYNKSEKTLTYQNNDYIKQENSFR